MSAEPIAWEVLGEAAELVSAKRRAVYGPAQEDFEATAAIWTVLLHRRGLLIDDARLEARDVPLLMVGLKLSREANLHGRDNCVDAAGYAALIEEVF